MRRAPARGGAPGAENCSYWGFDIAALGLLASSPSSGCPGRRGASCSSYFLGTLGSLLPLPGGIGGVEGAMIGSFVAVGIPGDEAVVSVLAYRAISFWLPTLPGVAGYFALRRTVRRWEREPGDPPAGLLPGRAELALAAAQAARFW